MQVENGYLNLDVASDRDTLIQQAFVNLAVTMPGWKPREGNLDVLLIEQFAEMASEAAQVAASVPLSIFSYYGSLLGITQNTGTAMVVSTTWTLAAPVSSSTFFPAGTVAGIQYNGVYYQFQTNVDFTIAANNYSATNVIMTAVSSGTSYNSVGAGSYLQTLYYIANLSTILIDSVTTTGLDAESTNTYLDRLTNTLTTYAPRPIVANDYATLAQPVAGVGRAVAYDNTTPLVNQLPVGIASPATGSAGVGWSAVNNATLANTISGVSVVPNALTSIYTYALASSYTAAAGDTFLPFVTTVTTNISDVNYTTSTTSIAINNALTQFPAAAGVGYIQNKDGTLTRFTYSTTGGAVNPSTLTVVFATGGTYVPGALIAFAGITNFATAAPSNVGLYISSSGTGTPNESVFVKSVVVNGSVIGWDCSPLKNAYPATITYSSAAGATTGDVPANANSANLVGFVASKLSISSNSLEPVLVAKITYKDNTVAYYYSNLVSSEIGTYAGNGIAVYIPGLSPNSYSGTISDPTIPATFARGISTVNLTMYYPGATSTTTRYINLASLTTTNKNVSFYKDGAWRTSDTLSSTYGNNNPANIVPDALFQSVYSEHVVTTGSASVTSTSLPSTMTVASTAGWPTSGTGMISNGSTSLYFMYTGLSATQFTGVTWSYNTTGTVTFPTNSTVTSLMSGVIPQQWNISGTNNGKVNPMPGYGFQVTPLATDLGGQVFIASNDFALPAGTYFLDATIDATSITAGTSYLPTVELRNAFNDALIGTAITAIANQKVRNNATPGLITVSSNTTAYIGVNFPQHMPTSTLGQSVLVTNIQLIPMTGSLAGVTTNLFRSIDALGPTTGGPSWTPGGYNAWNSVTGSASNNAPRSVMVAITDPIGMRPSETLMQNVENYLNSYREINFDVSVLGPTYQIVDIIYSVNAAKGYDPATVQTEILSNLEQYLSPTAWAGGLASPSLWDGTQSAINYLDVVGRIDDADGVANVTSLQIGARPVSGSTSYITSGSIPFTSLGCLPILGTVSGTIVASNSSVLEVN